MQNQSVHKHLQHRLEQNYENNRPVIGITMGDPAGIGPEIIVSALSSVSIHQICRPIVIGDIGVIEKAVLLKNCKLNINKIPSHYYYDENNDGGGDFSDLSFSADTINVLNLSNLKSPNVSFKDVSKENLKVQSAMMVSAFKPSQETGQAMIDYITKAVELCMSRKITAMVTAPITKTAFQMAGSQFHGHTELIAHRTFTHDYAMMLAGDRLKVVLVTIHIPLAQVSGQLTIDNIVKTIRIAGTALKNNFGIKKPRIAVAGLNPHSGENGMFGNEEERIILPAVKKAKEMLSLEYADEALSLECTKDREVNNISGFDIDGPFPPDTIFYHAAQGKYDCVICMYHDQGLIPFKLLHFSDGVNTTLGLPIIRTSVDHGTAYDIAWQNRADHTSLVQAIKMAVLQACSLNNRS
ncbi:MAG: 4-hydroxythreonine-4-phosphate dehydrogenase PdxA [Desulfamplus sp.]|nr:4-hydroxythreonine-4-phosphate dehydrogenase PdxA [Desulfamplus sp.]